MPIDDDLIAVAEMLKKAGYRDAVGRPRRGERPLIPELARRTGKSPRHIRRLLSTKKRKKAGGPAKESPAHEAVRRRLERGLGTKALLSDKGGAGTITISWHGYDHLDALLERLGV